MPSKNRMMCSYFTTKAVSALRPEEQQHYVFIIIIIIMMMIMCACVYALLK